MDIYRVLGHLQQSAINPVVRLAWDPGIPIPGDALLETTGRRTGLPRRTPVCDGLEGETFWLIAQRGRAADWVRNLEANLMRRLCMCTTKAVNTSPLTVCIDLDN